MPCLARSSRIAIWSRVTASSGQNFRLPQPVVTPACAIPSIGRRSRWDRGTSTNMLVIGSVLPGDVPPPGPGLATVSMALPAVSTSEAGIETFSRVRETYAVVRAALFHRTTEAGVNPEPSTARLKDGSPLTAPTGVSAVIAGTAYAVGPTIFRTDPLCSTT